MTILDLKFVHFFIILIAGAATAAFRPVDGAPVAAGNASPQQQQTSSLASSKDAAAIAASGAGTVPVVGSGTLLDESHAGSQLLPQRLFSQRRTYKCIEPVSVIFRT